MQEPGGERYTLMRRATLIGALVNLLLGIGKTLAGIIGQSQVLVADGVHSFSDLSTDLLVLIAARHSNKAADAEHPYGHARIETAATVILGGMLVVIAGIIIWDATWRLLTPEHLLQPGALALAAAAASILANEGLYHYTLRLARQTNSRLLEANAWHHRSDALSSVVALAGIACAMAGLHFLDAVGAAIVALMIARIGVRLVWQNLQELIDTSLDAGQVARIRDIILAVHGVRDLHLLKTRRMGDGALVDVHILLDEPMISVSEGHQISEAVRSRLMQQVDSVQEAMVHIDPEDDEQAAPCQHLPLRDQLVEHLRGLWANIEAAQQIRWVRLHYLDGKVQVDVCLPLDVPGVLDADAAVTAESLHEDFAAACREDAMIGEVRLYFAAPLPKATQAD